MATRQKDGIGKDPEEVDASLTSDEAVLEHMEAQAEATADPASGIEAPSREELWQVIQNQQEQMKQMAERIDQLEHKVEDVEFEATTVEEVADQLESGKIAGEAGAEFIQQFIEVPSHSSKIDARTTKLFLTIIEESRVGTPVTSTDVVNWFPELGDSSNPAVQAKRVMERLAECRENGFYLGTVELKKHRGKNAIWLAE